MQTLMDSKTPHHLGLVNINLQCLTIPTGAGFSPSIVVKIRSLRHDLRVMTPARLNEQTDRLSQDKNGANGHSSSYSAGYHFVPNRFDLVLLQVLHCNDPFSKKSFLHTGVIIRFINHLPFLRKVTGTPIIAPQELHDWCRWLLCFCFTS